MRRCSSCNTNLWSQPSWSEKVATKERSSFRLTMSLSWKMTAWSSKWNRRKHSSHCWKNGKRKMNLKWRVKSSSFSTSSVWCRGTLWKMKQPWICTRSHHHQLGASSKATISNSDEIILTSIIISSWQQKKPKYCCTTFDLLAWKSCWKWL